MGEVLEYDPSKEPDPGWWLSLGESERLALVLEYHEKASVEYGEGEGGKMLHATFHCIVENQIAEGVEETQRVVKRKSQEWDNRHEAIHELARDISGDISYYAAAKGKRAINEAQARIRVLLVDTDNQEPARKYFEN